MRELNLCFEGPPSANGLPGIHHVMARAIKPFYRYKTKRVIKLTVRQGGIRMGCPLNWAWKRNWALPKEDIAKRFPEAYNEACRKAVMRYTDVWNRLTERAGYWVDMDHPYITYEPKVHGNRMVAFETDLRPRAFGTRYTIQPYSPKSRDGA